jgi:hypothetical protein
MSGRKILTRVAAMLVLRCFGSFGNLMQCMLVSEEAVEHDSTGAQVDHGAQRPGLIRSPLLSA